MKKLILLILVSVAVYGNIKECLDGDIKACEEVAYVTFLKDIYVSRWREGKYDLQGRTIKYINCNDFMKVMRKGCNLGSGLCCALLGDEFHSISVYQNGKWQPKYGVNCSLRNQDEAFKYYKKACDLGESAGCQRYTELQDDITEIDRRERDKTYKGDITIRQR